MKKVLLSMVMLIMAVNVFAQEQETQFRVPNGYQGFLEYGNNWTVFDKETPNTIALSTTHGFYFNHSMYAGIGVGVDFCGDFALVPIYGNFRYVILNNTTASPFVSVRLGSYVSEKVGAYGDLAFGVRFASKKDFAINVMVAGTYYDKIKHTEWEEYQDADGVWLNHEVDKFYNPASISLRIGIEW